MRLIKNMGKKVNLHGTPLFRIDGKNVASNDLEETIKKAINGE